MFRLDFLFFLGQLLVSVFCVEIIDVRKEIKECQGSHVGFGFSGGPEFHYEALKRRYEDCTHVEGNLEITNLENSDNITYDLSFLSKIEVVTGYVLIGIINVETVPLTNLKLIRADNTYNIMGEEYGLVVALTSEVEAETENKTEQEQRRGLVELLLPSLREISRGKVLFHLNPLLSYVNTINWHDIVPGMEEPVVYGKDAYNENSLLTCDKMCETEYGSRCWGRSRFACQRPSFGQRCSESCPGRCYNDDLFGCCHPECAVGCHGSQDTDCEMCKYFKYGSRCVSRCPPGVSYRHGQECIRL